MKKFIYIFLLSISSALVISSCTEDVVKPVTKDTGVPNGGGNGSTGL